MSKVPFRTILNEGQLLICDGGFGTELFTNGVDLPNSSLANELYPEVVRAITRSYIDAGSDLVQTNTFTASPLHLKMVGRPFEDAGNIIHRAVKLAQEEVEEAVSPVYISGTIGPSPGAIEADVGDSNFGLADIQVREAHRLVGGTLASAGVDLLCVETMFSATEAAIAVDQIRDLGLPIAVNLTLKYTRDRKTGKIVYRTDWGHSFDDLIRLFSSGRYAANGDDLLPFVDIFGVNCGADQQYSEHVGMSYAAEAIRQLRDVLIDHDIVGKWLMAYPNAGMPKIVSNTTRYPHSSEYMASQAPAVVAAGASIIGGCCGSGPEHIRAIRLATTAG